MAICSRKPNSSPRAPLAGVWLRAIGVPLAMLAVLCLAQVSQSHAKARASKAYKQQVEQGFAMWISELRGDAQARGVSDETFNEAMKGVTINWSLPDLVYPNLGPDAPPPPRNKKKDRQQAEFARPSNYFSNRSISQMAKIGRKRLGTWKETLGKIEEQYGVQKNVVLAIWGRETGYGGAKIPHYAVRALATQGFLGRRKEQFREELILALEILQAGHVSRKKMASSWAGAMGHTQFLPSHFTKFAVDFNGDGRRDIWGTIPDALASTANHLRQNGWQPGKAWGYEIRLPKGFDCTLEGPDNARPIGEWADLGITRTRKRDFRDDRLQETAFLVLPAGTKGPAFLALNNFAVIKTYNKADLYALYVGHLADRIYDDRVFEGRWSKLASLRRNEVRRLQEQIAQSGIDVGKIDGLMGAKTRAAIGTYQKKLGQRPTCYPSRALLKNVKSASN